VIREVADIARSVGARLLVDEVYLDAVYENTPLTAARIGPEVLVTSSLTKVYGLSGLRCGWVLAEPDLARAMFRGVKRRKSMASNTYNQGAQVEHQKFGLGHGAVQQRRAHHHQVRRSRRKEVRHRHGDGQFEEERPATPAEKKGTRKKKQPLRPRSDR
jgi:aspartate/methionine/tyrosine aminotransferase